ncbi:MAG: aminoacyl-tRNA deacylase [Nitrososphaerales archaeon]
MTQIRTRVLEVLDEQGIPYRLLPHSEPVFTVEAAARQRGVVKEEMVKTILLRDRDGRYVVACVTGDARVDPRRVRESLATQAPGQWRRLYFAGPDEILAVTGCPMGAVAPVGLPEAVPVLFDEAIVACARVSISSGDPMLGLELDPQDLLRVTGARLAAITEAPPRGGLDAER